MATRHAVRQQDMGHMSTRDGDGKAWTTEGGDAARRLVAPPVGRIRGRARARQAEDGRGSGRRGASSPRREAPQAGTETEIRVLGEIQSFDGHGPDRAGWLRSANDVGKPGKREAHRADKTLTTQQQGHATGKVPTVETPRADARAGLTALMISARWERHPRVYVCT